MNVQITACQSALNVLNIFHSHCGPSMLCVAPPDVSILRTKSLKLTTDAPIFHGKILPKTYMRLKTGASSYQRWAPVCLFGGKGKPENDNEVSPWKSLEKAMGNLKNEQSVEDALRQQIEKQEYYDDGGSGSGSGGGGGGGGGGSGSGSGSGSGGSGDEGILGSLDEALQVILATVGLILLYIYVTQGGDRLILVARDYIRFLFGAEKSNRLRRVMNWCRKLYRKLTIKKFYKPYPLECEIVNTPTMWDDPIAFYGMVEDDPYLDVGAIPLRKPREDEDEDDAGSDLEKDDDQSFLDSEKDDDQSFLASGEVDESSLKSGEDGESYLDSREIDEPYLASKEEYEPDLASKEEYWPDLASIEEYEPLLVSKIVDEADLLSREDDESDLLPREYVQSYLRLAESVERDRAKLDKINFDLLEAYFAPRVKVVERNVEKLDVNILVDGKEYETVKVIVGDDEDEDDVVEDEDENYYVGNMEENGKGEIEGRNLIDSSDEFDGVGEIEGDSDYLSDELDDNDVEFEDEDDDVDDIEGDDDEYEYEDDDDVDDTEGDDDI